MSYKIQPRYVVRSVRCPVCGEPGMERRDDMDDMGCSIISCTNHACASNGGPNSMGLKISDSIGTWTFLTTLVIGMFVFNILGWMFVRWAFGTL